MNIFIILGIVILANVISGIVACTILKKQIIRFRTEMQIMENMKIDLEKYSEALEERAKDDIASSILISDTEEIISRIRNALANDVELKRIMLLADKINRPPDGSDEHRLYDVVNSYDFTRFMAFVKNEPQNIDFEKLRHSFFLMSEEVNIGNEYSRYPAAGSMPVDQPNNALALDGYVYDIEFNDFIIKRVHIPFGVFATRMELFNSIPIEDDFKEMTEFFKPETSKPLRRKKND